MDSTFPFTFFAFRGLIHASRTRSW
jgi:hypothetical protein